MSPRTLLLLSFALLAACSSTQTHTSAALVASAPRTSELALPLPPTPALVPDSSLQESHPELYGGQRKRPSTPSWAPGQPLMHGFLGMSSYTKIEAGPVSGDDSEELPLIGGGAQWKLGGERVDYGLEGLLSFSGSGNVEAFVVGGGGAAVAIDVDLLVFELYGGPFASMYLGEKLRLYGAVGPLLQWADYEQTGNGLADDGSGFGYGYYGRTGLELVLPSRTLLGFGVRWSDTSVDLGGSLDDLELEGLQFLFTVSRWV